MKVVILLDQSLGSGVQEYAPLIQSIVSQNPENTVLFTYTSKHRRRDSVSRLRALKSDQRATVDVLSRVMQEVNMEADGVHPDHYVFVVVSDHADNASKGDNSYILDHLYSWSWKIWVTGRARQQTAEELGIPDHYIFAPRPSIIERMFHDLEHYGDAGTPENERF